MNDKILEQLHYFNIQSKVDSVYGDWVVTEDGDLVNFVYPFAILHVNIEECDWLIEIKRKSWYDLGTEKHFLSAFDKALKIYNKRLQNE